MYKAMLAAAYYGLLRIGELTYSQHVIKAKDVFTGTNKDKLMFVLHSSKTHNPSQTPQIIKITASPTAESVSKRKNNKLCPFTLIQNYIDIRDPYASDNEQFFVFADRSPVMAHHYRTVFKKLIVLCNLDSRLYSCHGTRAGHATDLLEMGISVETIRLFGRWKSNSIYAYLKQ